MILAEFERLLRLVVNGRIVIRLAVIRVWEELGVVNRKELG